jgi:exonuclease SbcC
MRLKGLELNGFRAFAVETAIDLDADAVILVGPNGSGKTSLLDALLWTLCGRVPRISDDDKGLLSLYSETGRVRTAVQMQDESAGITAIRSFDGQHSALTVRTDGAEARGSAAFAQLCESLWPAAMATDDESMALCAALTRSVYLQQDLVRQFIEADSDQGRFVAVSELVGAGRIAELQVQVDNERSTWTRVTHEREAELEQLRSRLASQENRLASLASMNAASMTDIEETWSV